MRSTIRVWIVITMSILMWVLQFNLVTDIKASQYLKEEMELALHDAGLFLRYDQLAEGFIVFDREAAFQSFVISIERNTNLKQLKPTEAAFYQDEFRVLAFEVFDDSNTLSFPLMYSHPVYPVQERFDGPTILAIIETFGPRAFNGEKRVLRRVAAYTYER